MFVNSRTGQKATELRGYKTENEGEAKARLEAAGWGFPSTFAWDEGSKVFSVESEDGADEATG